MSNTADPVVRLLLVVGTIFLAALLALNVWFATSDRADTLQQISERTSQIEEGLTTLTCIALIPDDERTDMRVAECSVNPEGDE